jgi:hypothetical protein
VRVLLLTVTSSLSQAQGICVAGAPQQQCPCSAGSMAHCDKLNALSAGRLCRWFGAQASLWQAHNHTRTFTSSTCRAFVPLAHLSDAGGRKGKAKWQVGQEVAARVLEADAVTKRTTATLKKALVTSKLPLIVHLQVSSSRSCTRQILMYWLIPEEGLQKRVCRIM